MADDYETTRGTAAGRTTVIHGTRRGSGAGWVIAMVLILALLAGIWLFSRTDSREAARDTAVSRAAGKVGAAADEVGDAAKDAADEGKR